MSPLHLDHDNSLIALGQNTSSQDTEKVSLKVFIVLESLGIAEQSQVFL